MKKLMFKYMTRKQIDKYRSIKRWFYTRKVDRRLSYSVRAAFKSYFDGVYNFSNCINMDDEPVCGVLPQTTVELKDLGLVGLDVYRYKGVLTLEIRTPYPGLCVGKGGNLYNSYTKHIQDQMNDSKFKVSIVECLDLFKY